MLKKLLRKIKKTITLILNTIFSFFFYFIGIGITSLIAKFVGKKFLQRKFIKTSWFITNQEVNLTKQY